MKRKGPAPSYNKQEGDSVVEAIVSTKKIKLCNGRQQDAYIAQLACIPGCSMPKARSIAQHYPCWAALAAAFEAHKEPGKMLADLPADRDPGSGAVRRLGPVLAQRIFGLTVPLPRDQYEELRV